MKEKNKQTNKQTTKCVCVCVCAIAKKDVCAVCVEGERIEPASPAATSGMANDGCGGDGPARVMNERTPPDVLVGRWMDLKEESECIPTT